MGRMNSNTLLWLAIGGGVVWYLMSRPATTATPATTSAAIAAAVQPLTVAGGPTAGTYSVTNNATGTPSLVTASSPPPVAGMSGLGRWAA